MCAERIPPVGEGYREKDDFAPMESCEDIVRAGISFPEARDNFGCWVFS